MRFVVTGGAGFFGSRLLGFLQDAGHEVLSIDRLTDESLEAQFYTSLVDIQDKELLKQAMSSFGKVDGIFHAAAVLAHDRQNAKNLWNSNVVGTHNVMEVARELKIPKVVFTSSNCIFASNFNKPVDEFARPCPIEPYGQSKLAAEEVITSYDGIVASTIIRCPTIIAPGRLGLLTILFDFVAEGRCLYVIGDGDNRYSFIDAHDLARACLLAMLSKHSGIYHIGSDDVPTMRQLYQELAHFAGTKAKIIGLPRTPSVLTLQIFYKLGLSPLGPYHFRALASNFVFNTSKIKHDLNWAPTIGNVKMLCQAYSYYVEHKEEIIQSRARSPHHSLAKAGILNLLRLIS